MKRKRWYGSALLLVFGLLLGGCAGTEWLEQPPRDFAVTNQSPGSREEEEGLAGSGAAEDPSVGEPSVEETEEEPTVCFLREEAFEYAGQSLDETGRLWYEEMKQILGGFGAGVRLDDSGLEAGFDEEDIDRIFQCVLIDHPELFYVEGYSYTKYTRGERTTAIEFSGSYSVDPETAQIRMEEIEAAAEEILSGLEENADQYTRVKYVYDTIIRNTDYDLTAPDNQNIYSVFVNRRSVCQGYAKATQYLLNRLGVECTLVLGTVDTGEGHAWNLVRVDGSYYYVDTTWGDASYRMEGGGEEAADMPQINYDYLNVTTAELLKTHSLGDSIPLPVCIDTSANYYYREGALFSFYDREQLERLFERAREQGREDVTVKCADQACYEEVTDRLIGQQEIFDFLGETGGAVAYAQNGNQLSLTFWVTNDQGM
ncbi:MAG: hypothetical protein NC432_00575 [Roseburia sp.]|nr:hypothetical protein [Roseburia sp.]MCM1098319.1 hypothetical protein [Ruminococcus flavefaciens]